MSYNINLIQMTVIPLGTNGFFPSFGRETACYAIPFGKILIFLDAGSGLFRLQDEAKELLDNVDEIHIFLSHYHLDHAFGFYAAFALFKGKKVVVFGPEKRQVFSDLTQIGYFPINFNKKHENFSWVKLEEGKHRISTYKVRSRKQNHRKETSLAYRFKFPDGKTLAYVTDGEPKSESIEFISGVDLLLHEHWYSGEDLLKEKVPFKDQVIDGHVTTAGTAMIGREAKVKQLVLIHHNPFADTLKLDKQLKLAKSIYHKTVLSGDLIPIKF